MMIERIPYVCMLMYETYRVSVLLMDEADHIMNEYKAVSSPFSSHEQSMKTAPHKLPMFQESIYLEQFMSISLIDVDTYKGRIIVGPVLSSKLSDEAINGLIHDFHLHANKKQIAEYYGSLPVISSRAFLHMGMLLHYMIYEQQLNESDVLQYNQSFNTIAIEDPYVHISKRRQSTRFHHDPIHERNVMRCITEGRTDEVIRISKTLPESSEFGLLAKNSQLRNLKNLAIATITLATRAAMEGGLHHEIAYTLSDMYIQKLEELTSSTDVNNLMDHALYTFAERVQQEQRQSYSKPVMMIQNYIFTHLYEPITLSQLGDLTGMNPRYVSTLFKKETGLTVSEYMQRQRIEEAKHLLTRTEYTLSEICTMLCFHDQSYFTKMFKKFTKMTPKQFRDRGLS